MTASPWFLHYVQAHQESYQMENKRMDSISYIQQKLNEEREVERE